MAAGSRNTPHAGDSARSGFAGSHGARPTWSDVNAQGVALAAANSWELARECFAAAVDELSADGEPDVTTHHALALVLGNLAQASFRAGDSVEAIRHAQRGCALRVALVGEDAVTVARARSDLAVMLAATGRVDESPALLSRAIAGIEQSAGDEDLRLAAVLENAARVALAAGQPANAEPHLIRLHALLAAHDFPTDRADVLVSRIMSARSHASNSVRAGVLETVLETEAAAEATEEATEEVESEVEVEAKVVTEAEEGVAVDVHAIHEEEVHAETLDDEAIAATEIASATDATDVMQNGLDDGDEWDDQPLRDAVVMTDALLRTTPSGNRAIRADDTAADPFAESEPPALSTDAGDHIFGDAPGLMDLDLVDDQRAAASYEQAGAEDIDGSTSAADGNAPAPAPAPAPGGLGFVVEYGIPRDTSSQPAIPDRSYEPPAIRGSDAIAREAQSMGYDPDEDGSVDLLTPPGAVPSVGIDAEIAPSMGDELELVPEAVEPTSLPAAAAPTLPVTPPQVERRKTPRHVSVVMPSPAGGAPVVQSALSSPHDIIDRAHAASSTAARPTVHTMQAIGDAGAAESRRDDASRSTPAGRAVPRVGTRLTKEPAGSKRGLAIGGGIAALIAAAAGWFFLRGGM